MKKSSRELYYDHYTKSHGDGSFDWSGFEMYKNHFSLKCRKGFFESAEKVKNIWLVEESEYFDKAEEFSAYMQEKRINYNISSVASYNDSGVRASVNTGDDIAKVIGGVIGIVIALVLMVGFLKIVAGATSYSSSGTSNFGSSGGSVTRSINGTSYTQKEFEDKLRKEAEDLFDSCQIYGKSYSEMCP